MILKIFGRKKYTSGSIFEGKMLVLPIKIIKASGITSKKSY
jgi:hypothetical protein